MQIFSALFQISNFKSAFLDNGLMDFDNLCFKLKHQHSIGDILSDFPNFAFYYFYSKICTFYNIFLTFFQLHTTTTRRISKISSAYERPCSKGVHKHIILNQKIKWPYLRHQLADFEIPLFTIF